MRLKFVIAALLTGSISANAAESTLACVYKMFEVQSQLNEYGRSQLSHLAKPLSPDSPELAIVLMSGTESKCEACSGLKDAAVVILESGTYALPYDDEFRSKMIKGSDYIDVLVEGTEAKDLYVNIHDQVMISRARANTGFNSIGTTAFWPQINSGWKQNVSKDTRHNFQPIKAQSLNGTPAGFVANQKIQDMLNKHIVELKREMISAYAKIKNEVDSWTDYATRRLPERIAEANQTITSGQIELAELEKDFEEIQVERAGKHSRIIQKTLQQQHSLLVDKLSELREKIRSAKATVKGVTTDLADLNRRLAIRRSEMEKAKQEFDAKTEMLKQSGLEACAK